MCKTLNKIWQQFNNHNPDTALWENGRSHSYQELGITSRYLAHILQEQGLHQQTIAFFSTRDLVAYTALLGTLFSGNILLPLNISQPISRQQAILQSAKCTYIVSSIKYRKQIEAIAAKSTLRLNVIWLDNITKDNKQSPSNQLSSTTYRQLFLSLASMPLQLPVSGKNAYLMFTSGTTGTPKGILISHNNLDSYTQYLSTRYQFCEQDKFSQHADLTFDLSVHDWSLAWTHGAALYVVPAMLKSCPSDFIARHKISCWLSVPNVISMCQAAEKLLPASLPSLRLSFFCGQALAKDHAAAWQQATTKRLINLYGPTEATIAISHHEYSPATTYGSSFVPIGKIFSSQDYKLSSINKEQTTGELLVRGSQVISHYWHNPEADSNAFYTEINGSTWYRTGDLVSANEQQELVFLGRLDQQVKIGGHRIELGDIETQARQLVNECTALAWPIDKQGEALGLTLAITIQDESQKMMQEKALHALFDRSLPNYMRPKTFVWFETLPVNINGKTDIKAIRAQLDTQALAVLYTNDKCPKD